MKWPTITPAAVCFREGGGPESRDFGDIYHMPGRGIEEKTHVFLDGINLDSLLKTRRRVTIGELGFGLGLNFMLSWQRARALGKPLDYVAIEGFPLKREDLQRALGNIDRGSTNPIIKNNSELDSACYQLKTQYPPLVAGVHKILFDGGKTTLTLVFGDVLEALRQINGGVDAWYLDGFSPAKNPAMWSQETLREVARLSRKGVRLATYSAAGSVRRGLETAGFAVEKREGFGEKRDSLTALYKGAGAHEGLVPGSRIAVVGGGIAGCSAAYALTARGYDVDLFEKENRLAPGTSGHALAVFKPKLQRGYSPYSQFFLSAYLFSLGLYEGLGQEVWHPARGALEIAPGAKEKAALTKLAQAFPALEDHVEVVDRGLYFPNGGCLVPEVLCQALAAGAKIHFAKTPREADFAAVVYANGRHAFEAFGPSPFRLTRGQSNYLPALRTPLRHVISFPGGYLTPATEKGVQILGTSFAVVGDPEREDWQALEDGNLEKNLAALAAVNPDLAEAWADAPLEGRVALRTETVDHVPVAGPAFDPKKLAGVFRAKQKLHKTRRDITNEATLPGRFVLSGFASRGFTAAPYAAEILASQIAGRPRPCPAFIEAALDPKRFDLKALKRA